VENEKGHGYFLPDVECSDWTAWPDITKKRHNGPADGAKSLKPTR